jgi:hypothetical protein
LTYDGNRQWKSLAALCCDKWAIVNSYQEVERLQSTRPPFVAVVASAAVLAEGVAVEVEQRDEERDDADRVGNDENSSEDRIDLVAVGVAVDGEAVISRARAVRRFDASSTEPRRSSLVLMKRLALVDFRTCKRLKGRTAEDSVDLQMYTVSTAIAAPVGGSKGVEITMKSQPMPSQAQRSLAPCDAIASTSSRLPTPRSPPCSDPFSVS